VPEKEEECKELLGNVLSSSELTALLETEKAKGKEKGKKKSGLSESRRKKCGLGDST